MEAFLYVPQYKRIDLLYSLIKQDPDILQAIDQKQFIDTPLHFAAGEGLTQLALEIQRLMPSFGKKLNADGYSPLHLALQRGHNETSKAMIRLNPELVSVQGREGMTPLHYAAEMDDGVDILVEFLVRCPESIEMLTVREETAVHVAVKSRKLACLKVLVGWLKMKGKEAVLGWQDFEGNSALHLAASTNQPKVC